MNSRPRYVFCASLVAAVLLSTPKPARADAVLDWNAIAVRTLTTQSPAVNPFQQARVSAIVQLAVFEAVNAITRKYEPYFGSPVAPNVPPLAAPAGASADAAAAAAAHAVLKAIFPASAGTLDSELAVTLALIPDGESKTTGRAAGEAAAKAVMALRVGDGSTPLITYMPSSPSVGEWALTPNCAGGVLFNWRDVTPFGVVPPAVGHWAAAFRPEPPPALTSNEYAKAFNEVKTIGSAAAGPADRPSDRTTVARFYASASPTFVFHTVARQIADRRGDSLAENARNLALISMATSDSLVASFAAKYHYNYWRPVTAIPAAHLDGNSKTEAGAFTPLIGTPCFPGYPSNHASGSNGAAEMIRRIYGAAGYPIELKATVPGMADEVTLRYGSLEAICDDIDDARVYGGIHFRFDQLAGNRLGREVATFIYKNNLQPVHGRP